MTKLDNAPNAEARDYVIKEDPQLVCSVFHYNCLFCADCARIYLHTESHLQGTNVTIHSYPAG